MTDMTMTMQEYLCKRDHVKVSTNLMQVSHRTPELAIIEYGFSKARATGRRSLRLQRLSMIINDFFFFDFFQFLSLGFCRTVVRLWELSRESAQLCYAVGAI